MSVIVNLEVPPEDFAFGKVLKLEPGIRARFEPLIPTSDALAPYLRVVGADVETIEDAVLADPHVQHCERVDSDDEGMLFRLEWTSTHDGFVRALTETTGTVLEADGSDDGWSFQLRFPDADTLSQFYSDCIGAGLGIRLTGVHRPIQEARSERYGLTSEQQETIVKAFEGGYFDIPRETTLARLSEQMNISDSAVSQRLRRGLSTLVSATVLDDHFRKRDFEDGGR